MIVLIFLILQCLALLNQPNKVELPALSIRPTTFRNVLPHFDCPDRLIETDYFLLIAQSSASQPTQAQQQTMSEPVSMLLKNFFVIGFGLILILAFLLYQAFEEKRNINKLLQSKNDEIQRQKEEIEKQKKIIEDRHDTLQQALFEIDQQKNELQTYNATKDKFFSIIAHDLKSPLNSLQGFSSLLMACAESLTLEDIKAVATKLNDQIKNTVQLTDNLLTWARLQMNQEELQAEALNLPQIVRENIDLLAPIAALKEVRLETNLLDLMVIAHAEHLKFILRNLIANAIKFSHAHSAILIEATRKGNIVEVSVTDHGIGMTQEMLDTLFRVDTRHRTLGTAGEKGTGLGLILSKEFVEKNKGQIWVKSKAREGSIFTFTLPTHSEE